MPPKRKPTMEEQLALAQAQLDAANARVGMYTLFFHAQPTNTVFQAILEAEAEAATSSKPKQRLIGRPKGQAGKGSGFNLRIAMRLDGNKTRYNRLMNIVRYITNQYLNTNHTIQKQDKLQLKKTIKKACGWPIREFIKQYLANAHDKHKRAVRQERAAEEADGDDWSAEAQGEEAGTESEGDEIQENKAPQGNSSAAKVKPQSQSSPEPLSPKKRKAMDSAPEDTPRPNKQLKSDSKPTKTVPVPTAKRLTINDIPRKCPDPHCQDLVLTPLPSPIYDLFARKHELTQKDGANALGCRQLTRQICAAITKELEPAIYREMAEQQGWPRPSTIDFTTLPRRIASLRPVIRDLLIHSNVLGDSPIWKSFVELIEYRIFAFSSSPSSFEGAFLGCGYFGPKGQSVMEHSLESILAKADSTALEKQLYSTQSALIDTPKRWDDPPANIPSQLLTILSPPQFVKFILVPFVATSLIAEDLDCTFAQALNILEDSRRCGEILQPLSSPTPPVHPSAAPAPPASPKRTPTENASEPPRHRKPKVTLTLAQAKTITLDDFTPPVVKRKTEALDTKLAKKAKADSTTQKATTEMNGKKKKVTKEKEKTDSANLRRSTRNNVAAVCSCLRVAFLALDHDHRVGHCFPTAPHALWTPKLGLPSCSLPPPAFLTRFGAAQADIFNDQLLAQERRCSNTRPFATQKVWDAAQIQNRTARKRLHSDFSCSGFSAGLMIVSRRVGESGVMGSLFGHGNNDFLYTAPSRKVLSHDLYVDTPPYLGCTLAHAPQLPMPAFTLLPEAQLDTASSSADCPEHPVVQRRDGIRSLTCSASYSILLVDLIGEAARVLELQFFRSSMFLSADGNPGREQCRKGAQKRSRQRYQVPIPEKEITKKEISWSHSSCVPTPYGT
ncbi:hypothetical protein B0H14DRAFT_2614376 [Mycena olivaceomarginata]|nr:hypothetical protein B0H14DRAFT_2614376 [Mycena olivaceomarginata]